jgi:serine/threonine protein kinase/tetratricopeptide (TPR) repeat protein
VNKQHARSASGTNDVEGNSHGGYHLPSMPPEDGDPAPKPGSSAAFAATVAPVDAPPASAASARPAAVTPPAQVPDASRGPAPPSHDKVATEATMAAVLEIAEGAFVQELVEVKEVNYETGDEIARGGMGRIVAAEDKRLGRPVAIKQLLDPAPEQITRFQREALITARLQHPGIVPVYEAGKWPSGEPFFAMKLVEGKPLDKVIAAAPKLEDRLAILPRLAAACDAIAYAHSRRIIHRDLKPGNVLLGDYGETVVIDWGLAKDLDATDTHESANRQPRKNKPAVLHDTGSSTLTVAGSVMGTPAYMAPEQARGEQLDARADVFALGAMLYHVLTGVPPYNARTATDVIAAAALARVIPLRQREKRAPADLVAIVERAMAAEPFDRYPDAGELASELRRFLTGQLVDAHRYTAAQKVARFVKKHQAAVTISLLAVAGFSVGGAVAVHNIVAARDIARREQNIAETRKQAAEKLIDYMFSDMKKRLAMAGRLDMLAGIGTEVKRYYTLLSGLPGGMPFEDEIRMAEAIQLIGVAEHTSGSPDQALETYKQARERIIGVVGKDTSARTRPLRRMIARFDYETGRIFQERGKNENALEYFKRSSELYAVLAKEDPTWKDVLLEHADIHDRFGDLLRIDGKIDEAFEQYSEAKQQRIQATSTGGGRLSDENLALSTSHFKLGSVYQNRGESGAALEEYKQAMRLRETLLQAQPDNVQLQQAVLEVQREMGELQRQLGDESGAIDSYRRALPVAASLVRTDPTNTDWQYQRGNILSDLGFTMIDSGAFKDGLTHITEAIGVHQDLVTRDPKSSKYKTALSRSHTRAGDAELYLGKPDAAIEQYRAALEIRRELVDADAKNTAYRRSIAWSYSKLAKAHALQGNDKLALQAHEEALEIRQKLVAESPSQGGFKNELASSEIDLARMLATRDPKRSEQLLKSGVTRARFLVAGDAINNEWKETLVAGLIAQALVVREPALKASTWAEAKQITEAAMARAPQNAHWPGYLAEIHVGLAESAADAMTARDAWKLAFEILDALEKDGRLPMPRKPLLERARSRK